jgi:hypothetical protein
MLSAAAMIATLLAVSPEAITATEPTPSSRGLVVVLSPEVQDEVTRNAMARILGELGAAPFRVAMEPVDPAVDLMLQVETAGRDLAPLAAFAIVREAGEGPGSVAVWVSNRITQTTTVHRVRVRGGDVDGAASHLAIEAVELVRASMAGLWPRAPAPVTPEAPPPAVATEPPARLRMGIGVGLFLDAAPVLWAPALIASYGRPAGVALRLDLVGLGPGADVSANDGTGTGARLQRAAAWLGLEHAFRSEQRVHPVVSVGAGAQYLDAQGTGSSADHERRIHGWSALMAAGGGLTVELGPHLALLAEARGLVTWPSVVVQVGDSTQIRFDRLTAFTNVGLLGTF